MVKAMAEPNTPRYMIAAPERSGTETGNAPSMDSQSRANNGVAIAIEPTVVASGGLSSPIRLSQTRLAE
jgi:hypothetical protein